MVGHGGLNAGIGEGSSRSRRAQTLWETSHDRESLTCVQRLFHAGNKAEKKIFPPIFFLLSLGGVYWGAPCYKNLLE